MEILLVITCVMTTLLIVGITFYYSKKIQKKMTLLQALDTQTQDELLNYALANPNPVFGTNKNHEVQFANFGSNRIFSEWNIDIHDKLPAEWREVTKQIQLAGITQTVELNFEKNHFLLSVVPRKNGSTNFFGMEITHLKNLEKELERKVFVDDDSNLPNQAAFRLHLNDRIEQASQEHTKLGLIIIRLDDYYQILNTNGHDVAHFLIQELGNRLNNLIKSTYFFARLSENEFAIISDDLNNEINMANYVDNLLEEISKVFYIGGQDIYISLSLGIAFFPNDATNADTLKRNAQLAVNRTSHTHNPYEFFQRGMDEQLQLKREIIADLRAALIKNQLKVHYQPQIDIHHHKLIGCEALIRWEHPIRGTISPFYFITAAEESSLIEQIGEWILREVCMQITQWKQKGYDPIKVAVNISGRQILNTDLPNLIQSIMVEHNVDANWLSLELTESALVQNKEHAQKVMTQLKKLDLELSLDDFGTGYSSLSYLSQFPIDKLKIDRSFISIIESANNEYAITKGIIDLGHSMKLKVVAEGVETPEQFQFIHQHGCDVVQGYIFGRAQPADEFEKNFTTDWHEQAKKLVD